MTFAKSNRLQFLVTIFFAITFEDGGGGWWWSRLGFHGLMLNSLVGLDMNSL